MTEYGCVSVKFHLQKLAAAGIWPRAAVCGLLLETEGEGKPQNLVISFTVEWKQTNIT